MTDKLKKKKSKLIDKTGRKVKTHRRNRKIQKIFPYKDYRQYVNMEQGKNRTHHGRKIYIWVKVNRRKAGIKVEWKLESPKGANANRPPGKLTPDKRAFLSETQSKTNNKGVVKVTLNLSMYGGDKFRVGVRIAGSKKYKYSGWFSVWRKLYFDIVEMKTKDGSSKYEMPGSVLTRIKKGFEKSFIELQDTGVRHLGAYKDNFDVIENGFKWADKYCSNKGVPQKIHFSVIDHAAPKSGTYGARTKTVEFDANTVKYTSRKKIRPYDFSGHNWLKKAEYETMKSTLFGWRKTWKEFSTGKIKLDGKRGRRKIKVDFSGSDRTPSNKNKVKVKITYLQPGSYGGWGGSNSLHLLICRGEYLDITTSANANNQIIVAGMHEVGHALALVKRSSAWHDSAHKAHCVHKNCTMWFESSPGNEEFHNETISDPGCRTFVREADLSKNALKDRWKFPR